MTSSRHKDSLVLLCSFVVCLFALPTLSLASQSDDAPRWCTNAKTKVEKLICERLGPEDRELGLYYVTLLTMVEPSAKTHLIRSQKRWIAEREQCGELAKTPEDLNSCVSTRIRQRSEFLRKAIAGLNGEKRLAEFNEFHLKTYREAAFEFKYPSSWQLETTEDGRISLTNGGEDMLLGFETAVTSSSHCTYSENDTSEDEIRRDFSSGKKQIGGREFERFDRDWLPSGHDEHYYRFFSGRCFAIDVSDNSTAPVNCFHVGPGSWEANCVINESEAKDLMAYSDAILGTVRFSTDKQ
jgi:uncharacterized protein YecT (DUF1311 family)